MIIQLQPEQIVAYWDAVKHAVKIAHRIPVGKEQDTFNHILSQALSGKMQVWIGYEEREGEKVMYGLGVTALVEDILVGGEMLLLHTLYAWRPIPEEMLSQMIPKLRDFAKESQVTRMITFTDNARLKEYYQSQGFSQDLSLYIAEV